MAISPQLKQELQRLCKTIVKAGRQIQWSDAKLARMLQENRGRIGESIVAESRKDALMERVTAKVRGGDYADLDGDLGGEAFRGQFDGIKAYSDDPRVGGMAEDIDDFAL